MMSHNDIVREIDPEIARLTEARRLLSTVNTNPGGYHPDNAAYPNGAGPKIEAKARRRKLRPEARQRIVDAQRKRWARVRRERRRSEAAQR